MKSADFKTGRRSDSDNTFFALHHESAFKNVKFDNTKDFVCGMPLTAGVGDTAHYKGKVYGFCSKQCKQIFLDNPGKYVNAK